MNNLSIADLASEIVDRKDKTFKELFNEYRKKENPCGG